MAAALSLQHQCSPLELPVQDLQSALLNDPIAPAAVMPIWTIPVWHDAWRSSQHEALHDPISMETASMQAVPASDAAPLQESAIQVQGTFLANSESDWQLQTSQGPRQLMTLEPGVRNLLTQCDNGTQVSVVAAESPWGPWLRVLRATII